MSLKWDSDSDSESSGDRDPSRRVFHGDGTQSQVYRQLGKNTNGSVRWTAVKVVSYVANVSTKPHDIVREARLLMTKLRPHPNIVAPYDFSEDDLRQQYELTMPLIPLSLSALLESPSLLPSTADYYNTSNALPSSPLAIPTTDGDAWFEILAKSLSFQIVLALEHLHNLSPSIAHRDIKPGNVLIDETGCVKVIDFGIAWDTAEMSLRSSEPENAARSPYDIPEETAGAMISQVGSGTYRAIELLFSPPVYDPFATDLWSLGVTLSMFFTDLRWVPSDVEDDESDGEDDDVTSHLGRMRWSRRTLFKASRGEIGLIWSIFRLLGTPTNTTWPEFRSLPGAKMMSFTETPPSDLHSRLPNLPQTPQDSSTPSATPLDLMQKLIVLDPTRRLSASDAVSHGWFWTGVPLVLPPQHARCILDKLHQDQVAEEWNGWSLRDILRPGVEQAFATFSAAL